MNQYPREFEDDELDSIDEQVKARITRRKPFPGKIVIIGTAGSGLMRSVFDRTFEGEIFDSVIEDWPKHVESPPVFTPAKMDFGPIEGRINFHGMHESIGKLVNEMREAEERLQRAYENFAAQWGESEMQRIKGYCETLNLNFYAVADFYAQVKASEIQERNRREELRAAVAQLTTVVPPSGKLGRSEIDRIPVPKKYKRNRFKQ